MFPPRSATTASTDPLDQAPPSPQSMGSGPTGQATPFSMGAVAPPLPTNQMPPEMLTSILQSAQQIGSMLDAYAQATPDMAADWGALKDHLAAVLAKLSMAGAGATSPTATGSQFPAAFDRGVAGAGVV